MSSAIMKRLAFRGLTTNFSSTAPHLSSLAMAPPAIAVMEPTSAVAAIFPCAKQVVHAGLQHADLPLLHVRGYASGADSSQLPGWPQKGKSALTSPTFAASGTIEGAVHLGWGSSRQLRGVHKAGDPLIGGESGKGLPEEENLARAKVRGATSQSYWSIPSRALTRPDGTPWPWKEFTPEDSYKADTSIDLTKHHKPETFGDWVAYRVVKLLRIPTDLLFQRRYGCRAMMLETVAAVPGMVGGMLIHLQSLRRFEHTGGWIRTLLDEAENERMHLMTFMEVSQPKWWERMLVLTVQGVFFNAYFVIYILSPRIAHRVVGYLEEEAIHSYTEFLKEIDNGNIPNAPAPQIAIDYWNLPKDATLRDVVTVVRADEAHHRDVNHFASGVLKEGRKLREVGAPQDYH